MRLKEVLRAGKQRSFSAESKASLKAFYGWQHIRSTSWETFASGYNDLCLEADGGQALLGSLQLHILNSGRQVARYRTECLICP